MAASVKHRYAEKSTEKTGLKKCVRCGFEIPESLVICWKCGKKYL
jgi:hypothetical protein